jgi:hypothetical protein
MLAVTITNIQAAGGELSVCFRVVPSGTYLTGGEIVNLAAAAQDVGFQGMAAVVPASGAPVTFCIWDQSGNTQRLATTGVLGIAGTTPANGRMACTTTNGTELANGAAYPATVLAAGAAGGLVGEAIFRKLI